MLLENNILLYFPFYFIRNKNTEAVESSGTGFEISQMGPADLERYVVRDVRKIGTFW